MIEDFAPYDGGWLLLMEDGRICSRDSKTIAQSNLVREEKARRHLHLSRDGKFAAVVNDYGRYGQLLRLDSGEITLHLDGGDYYFDTVPFSFCFFEHSGRTLTAHRTGWNRLDITDPANGELLTPRESPKNGAPHYLDYFHGGLFVSPDGKRIADDGWVWHPVALVRIASVDTWLRNPWAFEDESREITARDGWYWDRGLAWIDDPRLAIAGVEEFEKEESDTVRIVDTSAPPVPHEDWIFDVAPTLFTIEGAKGMLFSDGKRLYSSRANGLSAWDVDSGKLVGVEETLHPTRFDRATGVFAECRDGELRLTESARIFCK